MNNTQRICLEHEMHTQPACRVSVLSDTSSARVGIFLALGNFIENEKLLLMSQKLKMALSN